MNQQDYTGYIHSTSERAQSHGQIQSESETQFGSGQFELNLEVDKSNLMDKSNLVVLVWRSKC